ncbi:MAG TPA: type II toxin-antitoxin system prevent-host-death family antitoxin [Thermoanaerobaculia bacterium]
MKTIAQRELRNRSGEVLREVERGEQFLVTVGGRPVAQLGPYQRRRWVPRAEVVALLRTGASDPTFFEDIAETGGTADQLVDPWKPR